MGHERIGFLPKSQSWRRIIDQLSQFSNNENVISQIADKTLENIRSTYKAMPHNESVIKAMQFLVTLSISAKSNNQTEFLNAHGININKEITLFTLARCAKFYISTEQGSLEINKIASDAVLETIAKYEHRNQDKQNSLFDDPVSSVWTNIGTGAAFCELARDFFSAFTDRHLRYYIEREAANTIDNFQKIENFSTMLTSQISQHAYETSKIMQSFAAGWFNKYAIEGVPSEHEIRGFLNLSFEKMREEFRREAEKI
jgi:hypothetical protein